MEQKYRCASLRKTTALWTGILLFGLYFLTTGGQAFISDGEIMLLTTVQMVDAQTIKLPDTAAVFPQVVHGHDGFLFSRYGIGQPLMAVPFYWVGRYVIGWYLLPGCDDWHVGRFFLLLLPAAATAITGGLLCSWAAELYRSVRAGIGVALLYGVSTLAWPYSRFFFSEPLFTLFLVFAALSLFRWRPFTGGLAYGYAVATRVGGLVLLPAFLLYGWLLGYRWRELARLVAGMVPFGALILLHNWLRFGTWSEQGYQYEGFSGNLLEGLYGLLLSPGKSVFLYVPILLLLPVALISFARNYRSEMLFIAAIVSITLVESATWWIWWAGWGWGPRFLIPLMPFLVLILGTIVAHRGWKHIFGLVLLPLSIGVNLLGILVDFNGYLKELTKDDPAREIIHLFDPAHSPILAHIDRFDLHTIPIVSFSLAQPGIGFPPHIAPVISLGMVLLTVGAVVKVWFLLHDHERQTTASQKYIPRRSRPRWQLLSPAPALPVVSLVGRSTRYLQPTPPYNTVLRKVHAFLLGFSSTFKV
jgi:hypothetical protein